MRFFKRSPTKKKSIDALARGGGAVHADPTLTVLATVPIAQPDEDAQLAALEERKKALEAKKRQMEKKMMKKKRSKTKHKKVWEVEAEEEAVRKRAMAAALQSPAPKRRSKRHAKKGASWRKAGLDSVKEDAPLDAPNGKARKELDSTPLSPVSNKTESTHKIDNRRKAKAPGGGLLLHPLLAESDSLTTEDGSTATSVTDRTPLLEELKGLKELDPLFSGARALDEARETIMGFDDNVDVVVDDEQPQQKGSAWASLFSCGAGQCHIEADEPAEDTNAANDAKEGAESDSDGSSDDEGEDGDEDNATAGEHTLATYDSELASVESGTLVTFETSGTRTTATSALSGSTCDTDDTDTMASLSMGDSTVDTRSEAGTENTEASSQAEEEPTKSSWFGAFRLGRSGPTPKEEADAAEPASDEGGEDAAKTSSTGGDASSKESKESSARSGRPSIVKRLRNTPSPRLASMIAKKLAEREAAKGDSPATVATEAPPTVDDDAPTTEEEASGSVRPSEAEAPEAPSEEERTPEESEHASQPESKPESKPEESELESKPAPEDDRAAQPLAEKAPAQQEIELQISPLVALPESKAEEPGPTATEEAAPVNDTKKHKRTASSSSKLFDKFHRAKDSSASVAKSAAPKKEAKEARTVKHPPSSHRRGAKSVKSTPSMYTKRGMKNLRGSPGMFDKMLAKTKSTSPVPRPAEDDPAHEGATMDASRPKESVVVDERTSSVEVSVPQTLEGRDEEEDELAPLPRVGHDGERDGGDGARDEAAELVREASVTDQLSVATDALMMQAQELLGLEIAGQ